MNSKRQRRPNVRLGEVGDFSAALYCWNYQHQKQSFYDKRWKPELQNPTDPGVSSRDVIDTQQNRENRNPNSLKSHFDFGSSDEVNKPRLDFGLVTRKGRLMKRVKRGGRNNLGVGGAWISRVYPEIDDGGFDTSGVNGLKESFHHETSVTSEESLENQCVEPVPDVQAQGDFDECWMGDGSNKCDALYYDNPQSSGEAEKIIEHGVRTLNSVGEWLEQIGFGMYAGLFEMHEVDKEVLPLLTLEDLKDMGISTVGPRRKLYSAIQLLKGEVSV